MTVYQMSADIFAVTYFQKKDVVSLAILITKNVCWHLVFSHWFLVANEKNTGDIHNFLTFDLGKKGYFSLVLQYVLERAFCNIFLFKCYEFLDKRDA